MDKEKNNHFTWMPDHINMRFQQKAYHVNLSVTSKQSDPSCLTDKVTIIITHAVSERNGDMGG